jgi:hypothetical protein
MRKGGKQTELGQALNGLVRRLDRKGKGAYSSARVGSAWIEVAGPMVAAHTTGAHLREGTLVVFVDSSIWATELTAMAEQYRTSINEKLGEDLVSTVRFTVSRKVQEAHRLSGQEADTEEFYKEDDVEPVPLEQTELAQIEASVANIPDAELREAVLRATVRDIEWKKGVARQNGR